MTELQAVSDRAGKPYRPSNGTEGYEFEAWQCDAMRCRYYVTRDQSYEDCSRGIILAAETHDPGEPGYPKHWVYGTDGRPTCTAYRPRKGLSDKSAAAQLALYQSLMRGNE